jgi:hypothetical protein
MPRTKSAIVRVASVSAFVFALCYTTSYYFIYRTDSSSLWKNFSPSPVSNSSRLCPDQNRADYFQTLVRSMGVSASKQSRRQHASSARNNFAG